MRELKPMACNIRYREEKNDERIKTDSIPVIKYYDTQ
jgi:hypothetical protein